MTVAKHVVLYSGNAGVLNDPKMIEPEVETQLHRVLTTRKTYPASRVPLPMFPGSNGGTDG